MRHNQRQYGLDIKRVGFFLFYLDILLIFFLSCSERERNNPFDAGGKYKAPVELSLEQVDDKIHLSWKVKNIKDFSGFRIYRSVDDTTNFSLLTQLSAERSSYTDSDVQYTRWYYYYITVLGKGIESSPSKIVKGLPGPGEIFIMSRLGYAIHHYSYDLLSRKNLYNLQFRPYKWAWDLEKNMVWISSPQFGTVSRLNLKVGMEDFSLSENLDEPLDTKWNSSLKKLYILDSEKDRIFVLNDQLFVDSLTITEKSSFSLTLSSASKLWILDSTGVELFDIGKDTTIWNPFDLQYKGQDILGVNDTTYILTTDEEANRTKLLIHDGMEFSQNTIDIDGFYYLVEKPKNKNYLWLAEYINENSYRIVKLSPDGTRLLEISTSDEIWDMQVNPEDNSLVVVQRFINLVSLYNSEGVLLSQNDEIYDPIRAFIR